MRLSILSVTLTKELRLNWQTQHRFTVDVFPVGAPPFVIRAMIAEEVRLLLKDELDMRAYHYCTKEHRDIEEPLSWFLDNPTSWFGQGVYFKSGGPES